MSIKLLGARILSCPDTTVIELKHKSDRAIFQLFCFCKYVENVYFTVIICNDTCTISIIELFYVTLYITIWETGNKILEPLSFIHHFLSTKFIIRNYSTKHGYNSSLHEKMYDVKKCLWQQQKCYIFFLLHLLCEYNI